MQRVCDLRRVDARLRCGGGQVHHTPPCPCEPCDERHVRARGTLQRPSAVQSGAAVFDQHHSGRRTMPLYCVSLGGSREAGMIYRVLCIVTVQTVACGRLGADAPGLYLGIDLTWQHQHAAATESAEPEVALLSRLHSYASHARGQETQRGLLRYGRVCLPTPILLSVGRSEKCAASTVLGPKRQKSRARSETRRQ